MIEATVIEAAVGGRDKKRQDGKQHSLSSELSGDECRVMGQEGPATCSLRRYNPDQVQRVCRLGISGVCRPAGDAILAQSGRIARVRCRQRQSAWGLYLILVTVL